MALNLPEVSLTDGTGEHGPALVVRQRGSAGAPLPDAAIHRLRPHKEARR